MKKQLGCIQVQVPPDIVDDRSTSDVTVNEGDNVTLTCTATGKPTPRIVWRREDGQKIVVFRPTATASASGSSHSNLHGTKPSSSTGTVSNATISSTADLVAVTALGSHHQHQHHQGISATTTRERSKGKSSIQLSADQWKAIHVWTNPTWGAHWQKDDIVIYLRSWCYHAGKADTWKIFISNFNCICLFVSFVDRSVSPWTWKWTPSVSLLPERPTIEIWKPIPQMNLENSTSCREFNSADQIDISAVQSSPCSLME